MRRSLGSSRATQRFAPARSPAARRARVPVTRNGNSSAASPTRSESATPRSAHRRRLMDRRTAGPSLRGPRRPATCAGSRPSVRRARAIRERPPCALPAAATQRDVAEHVGRSDPGGDPRLTIDQSLLGQVPAFVPPAHGPEDQAEVGGHVMAVVPAFDPLGVLDALPENALGAFVVDDLGSR